jgi:hypothetical protein
MTNIAIFIDDETRNNSQWKFISDWIHLNKTQEARLPLIAFQQLC